MKIVTKETEIGGRKLKLEVGRFAPQASAAVVAEYGETMVLATVVSKPAKEDIGYFPLSVEYQERLYAGGKIKGSRWVKREGRPSDEAVLIGRAIDRSIRPLFPKEFTDEVQVTITVLSVDLENDPDVLSIIATSAALSISSIPWNGPIGSVKVGLKEGIPFVNPRATEKDFSELELIVAATKDRIQMIEGFGREVPEKEVIDCLKFAKEEIKKVLGLITDLQKEVGLPKLKILAKEIPAEIKEMAEKFVKKTVAENFFKEKGSEGKEGSGSEAIKEVFLANLEPAKKKEAGAAFEYYWKKVIREYLLSGKRPDLRKVDEVRPIEIEVGILPRTHGSAMFKRGLTQVLTITTLGAPSLQQLIESAAGEESKRYIHHYAMPPFSIGEVGRVGNLSRREIGHGALAEKALEPVLPSEDKFPYTVRVVSEVMSSNGSTSMASTCGSTLSLMDAGVPISSPVAGIAMGLVTGEKYGEDGDFILLTDIAGIEDFNGDMDFKITGTTKGVTVMQMDTKIPGLTEEIIEKTLVESKKAREFILETMKKTLPESRQKLSQYAPRVAVTHVPVEKIGEIIGPGGRMIRKLIEETGANIDVQDDGSVNVSGLNDESVSGAIARIEGLIQEAEVGKIYEGEVKRIQPFGAFVEILPGKEGLVHVSKMSTGFVDDPFKVVSLGQKVQVKVTEVDDRGRLNLTMLLNDEKKESSPRPPRRDFTPRPGGFRSGPPRFGNHSSGPSRFRR
ncbi:polyribonucleotide nucleotidyltransferase [Candidatus Shapirobacteria bacterium CG03_land_8_20_14_0_80_39_12]|uniref:Polyribonucleotide nucleotidyltransferase n=1 Tax=Candidatus Shapirobacteria bacterium CG03_land_8_20_14_0_80_39_12 TaxID=1974879 RepID=A0A2M7BDL7_9BACT|nr:MAG: polyribonucleotide nucleotidyltransferase [Candidatus Shapirobacteria bacterium CG03_land_8_20_14_0_80_39_12]